MSDLRRQKTLWPSGSEVPKAASSGFSSLSPAKETIVYDTYWQFAAERHAVFFRRAAGNPPPWTDDAILREYKFTNAYRSSDRVSQYLIRNVIYSGEQSLEEVFFRTILFKLFNKIETSELLNRELGPPRYDEYSFDQYDDVPHTPYRSGDFWRRLSSSCFAPLERQKHVNKKNTRRKKLR